MAYKTIEDTIGNTPLVQLVRLPDDEIRARNNVVLAKLEGNNPAGSVKDRPALSMIRKAEERGRIKPGQPVVMRFGPEGEVLNRKINQVLSFTGLERVQVESAEAGDIVLINGIEDVGIGATICAVDTPEALPMITVEEPTLTMNFLVNSSPLAGREGKFVTSRQIRDRLMKELNHNVALRVRDTGDETVFEVSGRGELHLTILVENMRREGYELAVSRPRVVMQEIDGVKHEPY